MTDILIRDQLRLSVEAASGGKQTVLYTAKGQPSYMTIVERFESSEFGSSIGMGSVHPAFIVNDQIIDQIYVGTYNGSVLNGELVSQPYTDPQLGGNQTIWQLMNLARACGRGFHLMTNLEWVATAYRGLIDGGKNLGNTDAGGKDQKGGKGQLIAGQTEFTYTGSGGAAWTHNGSPVGIHDMVGNVHEFVTGLRVVGGEIQVSINNHNALYVGELYDDMSQWAAIHATEGYLITPQWTGSILTGDYVATTPQSIRVSDNPAIVQDYTIGHQSWERFVEANFTNNGANKVSVQALATLRNHGVYPIDSFVPKSAFVSPSLNTFAYADSLQERIPVRAGSVTNGIAAGLFNCGINQNRTSASNVYTGRPCYVKPF